MKQNHRLRILIFVLVTASLACSLPAIMQGGSSDGIQDGLTENYVPSPDGTPSNPFNYSPDQMAVINSFGNPTRFTIIFTDTDRQETWVYDTSGYTVVFRNGVKLSEKTETPQYREEMYATTLGPNQFYRAMGIDEVVLSTGRTDFTLVTLEGMDKESRLMYLKGLSVGLVDGKVNFVETIPAMTETLLRPEDFVPVVALTPEIEAALGSYAYSNIAFQDLAVFGCASYQTEFTLEGNTLMMVESGEKMALTPISENKFFASIEGVSVTLKFTPTGYVYWGEDEGVLYEIYAFRELSDQLQLVQSSGLSADEYYIKGTHTYQVDFCQAGEVFQSYQTTMDINFPEGRVKIVENEVVNLLNRLGTNFFVSDEDDSKTMMVTDIGFVWRFEDQAGDMIMVFTLLQ